MAGLLERVELHLVESFDDAVKFIEWMKTKGTESVVGLDTETSGFSPEHEHIRLIQFGDLDVGWAMSWEDWRGIAKLAIEGYQGHWVLHNSKFDARHIAVDLGMNIWDWPWHRTHDCMAMAHILDSQRPKGLKPLAARYVDARAASMQSSLDDGMKANKWTWGTVPIDFPPYWQYGALDPVLTVHMFYAMYPEIEKSYSSLYDLEMGAVRVTAKMEARGARINVPYCYSQGNKLMRYAHEARDYLASVYGLDNPTAMQLIKFFTENNIPLPEKHTKTGRQAMDAEVMDAIDHEVASMVQAIKRSEKWSHTYFDNFTKFADENGYIHPTINPMAARTGRMSITEPALQTLPRIGAMIRDAFIPSEGNYLLTIDADQIEARLTAHFSKDPGLISAFNDPGDFFCNIASATYGYEVKKGMKERDLIKGVVYGKVYGANVAKMAISAGVPIQQMEIANASFEKNFPGIPGLQRDIINTGRRRAAESADGRGYVQTPYGRILRSDKNKEYTLVNYLIQCHAAEILKHKIAQLDALLPDEAMMILPVHDEIVFDVPKDIVHDVKKQAEEILNESEGYAVPVTWSGDILTESWGEKYR